MDVGAFPVGAAVTRAELAADPHPALARLRAGEPVSWVPDLASWLVTSRDAALQVLRDARAFTVDDPRFSTARVIGPSMLSLDGPAHAAARKAFAGPFRPARVVTVSLAGANRDPATFPDPDAFDVHRTNARQHLAFAHGPHTCPAMDLARLEALIAVRTAIAGLPGLALDDQHPVAPSGLVFRKPRTLHVRWRP